MESYRNVIDVYTEAFKVDYGEDHFYSLVGQRCQLIKEMYEQSEMEGKSMAFYRERFYMEAGESLVELAGIKNIDKKVDLLTELMLNDAAFDILMSI